MNKKSLCILVDYFIMGGVERVIIDAVKLLKNNYDITLWIMNGTIDSRIREEIENDVKIKIENKTSKIFALMSYALPWGGWVLNNAIKDRFDYLIVAKQLYIMAGYSKIAKKIILWNHGDKDVLYAGKRINFFRKINKIRLRFAYHKFDSIWVLNEEVCEKTKYAFKLNNVYVLPNPINCTAIMKKADEIVEEDTIFSKDIKIVMVGRLSPEKGHIRVIEALGDVDRRIQYSLIIIGDGIERGKLEIKAKELGISDRIYFLGEKSNPYCYMKKADILICPSYTESFGLVMLEAMLLDVPVFTTDTTGGRNATSNGKYGKCVENSNEAIKRELKIFLVNKMCYQNYVVAAHRRAESFDKKEFQKKIEHLLEME